MNQESSHGDNSHSDPEDDDSSAEQTRRDDERGRTVLAKVGKAIQNGNKISLELHPVYKVPCGDNRKTLSTYIGVVVRERVNINYMKWRNVPREVVNEVYEFIGKGFDILSISKSWILRRASIRFRAFKTRLRKFWVYKSSGKIRKIVPWKYPWISQVDWDKFVEYCTSPEYQELSKRSKERSLQKKTSYRGGCRGYLYYEEQIIKELEKQKIHVTQVPRHLVWLKAHATEEDGKLIFKNPVDLEIAKAIGWSPCSLAIQGDKGIQIVATGEVEVTSEVIHIHNVRVGNGFRRVKVLEEIVSSTELPCPTEEFTFVCQVMKSFVPWPVHLIFPKAEGDKDQSSPFATPSPQTPSSSQASNNKKYVITDKDQAKLTTSLLRNFMREAMKMKLKDAFISITIPPNVYGHQHIVSIDYEDMLDWCFQRELGANHMSIFMKYLSEKYQGESISGMYGFCDFNYLSPLTPINDDEERVDYLARVFAQNDGRNINQLFFAPYHENRHWMLAVISPWNGTVFWLDPTGAENDIREFVQTIINDGIRRFSLKYRTDIKKFKKNPKIKWNKPECPRQTEDSVDCGYYICRYMLETIEKRRQGIPEQYFGGATTAYSQMKIDELRDMWIKFVQEYKLEDEED